MSVTIAERFTRALKAFKDAPPPKVHEGEVAMSDPRLQMFGKNFNTPYNPSVLVTRKGLDIFDLMKKDAQVKAALAFKKHAVLSNGWEICAPKDQGDEWEPKLFMEWTLKNMNMEDDRILEASFEHALIEILSAMDYGFSVTEKIITPLEYGPFGGKIGLKALKTRKPHFFEFQTDGFGNLLKDGVLQWQTQKLTPLPREKFLIYVYQHQFSNWYGESDLEAAYRAWWIKDNSYKWLAMLLERLGVPPIFFLYGSGYSQAQITELVKVAKNLQAATSGAIPRPTKDSLDFWSPELAGQADSVFIPSLEKFDKDISRALLMPSLIGATSDDTQGSLARSQIHFDLFVLTVNFVRKDIETVINQGLVRPLVDVNFDVEEYPYFRFLPINNDKINLFGKWLEAVKADVVDTQTDDEDHIRNMLKFPEQDESKRKKSKVYPNDPNQDPNALDDNGDPIKPEAPPKNQSAKFYRQTNKFERKVDFAQIASGLDKIEENTKKKVSTLLTDSRDAFLSYVSRRLDGTTEVIGDLRLKGMGDVQNVIKEFLRSAYALGEKTLRSELPRRFAASGPSFVPTDALRYLNEKAVQISGAMKDRLLAEAKVILMNAIKIGEPQAQTIAKLKAIFDPYLGDPTVLKDGEPLTSWALATVVRTNTTDAFNQGRLVMARDPAIAKYMRGMEFSAVMDDRTTQVCASLDGKIIEMGEPDLSRLAPPLHFNCRSILVPVTLDIGVDEGQYATKEEIGKAIDLAGGGFV